MIIKILENIAYGFYPKHVMYKNNTDFYKTTHEYKKLTEVLNSIEKNYLNYTEEVLETIQKTALFHEFYKADVTNLNLLDRCFNFQLVDFDYEKSKQYSICLNLSFLVPFYTIYVLEADVDFKQKKWTSYPSRNTDAEKLSYLPEITALRKIAENMNYYLLDEKIQVQKIHNINFQNIESGDFNFFNAFFLNEYYTKI